MKAIAYHLSKELVLGEVLARHSRKTPRQIALIVDGERFTYREFNDRVNRLAQALLSLGIGAGDKVAFDLFNGHEIMECYFAAFKIGAVAVPVNYRLAPAEVEYILENCEAKILVYDPDLEKNLEKIDWKKTRVQKRVKSGREGEYEPWLASFPPEEPQVAVKEEFPAVLMYTAGTTGKPKGAVLTHKNLYANITNWIIVSQITPQDCWLSPPPLFHIASLSGVLPHVFVGGRNVLSKNYRPLEALKLIRQEKISGMVLIPTMWIDFLQLKELDEVDSSSLKKCFSGGAILPVEVKKKIIARWGQLYESFGQTEMCPNVTMLLPEEALRKTASVGKAMPNVEIRVVDDHDRDVPVGHPGEAIYRGPTAMLEYYKNPEATAEAFRGGWFHSGDLVRMDEEGFVYIVGRKKDMIISGGENIYPAEIEEILYREPRILEAAVVGISDARWGESVAAVVKLKPGAAMTAEEVVEICRGELAGYKKPRHVFFVDDLPKNAAGKILKHELREKYGQTFPQE